MLRRSLTALVIALTGLVVMSGTALAAPTYAPATLSITSNGGGVFTVSGGNFGTPGGPDQVDLTVGYVGPSGLRHSAGLSAAAAAVSVSIPADADGNFTTTVDLGYVSTAEVAAYAVGSPSGKTAGAQIAVSGGTTSTTTVVVTGPAYVSPAGVSYDSSGTLASTGASIAAPIAIGAAALLAGLALLFFGTRGVIRRKGSRSTVG